MPQIHATVISRFVALGKEEDDESVGSEMKKGRGIYIWFGLTRWAGGGACRKAAAFAKRHA